MFTAKESASQDPIQSLKKMLAQFARTPLEIVDIDNLVDADKKSLITLIQAVRILNDLFMEQRWDKNHETFAKLKKDQSELGRARLHYYWLNKGPWSGTNDEEAFIPDVPKKPKAANFYRGCDNKEEIETWINSLSEEKQKLAKGFFTIISKEKEDFKIIPYSTFYENYLEEAAWLLLQAASQTNNDSLKKYLILRAEAFLFNDYYESDLAWLLLDSPLDVTIGPYETYEDGLFGYKACFEAYITLRDDLETQKLAFFSKYLQEIENHLPIDEKYRNPNLGKLSPIRVVNVIYSTGEAADGVQTAAFNLPNDESILSEHGGKKVLLRNIQKAKFEKVLIPIAEKILDKGDLTNLTFNAFFTHILAHELSHGLGPKIINVNGKQTTVREELKDLYSTIEEAKADVLGLFMLQYLIDKQQSSKQNDNNLNISEKELYLTYFASMFRTLRFGIDEAHSKGMAVQFNYLIDKGAILVNEQGQFALAWEKLKSAFNDLTHDLLMNEVNGDYAATKVFIEKFGKITEVLKTNLAKLANIPVDIEPEFVTAKKLVPEIIASGYEFENGLVQDKKKGNQITDFFKYNVSSAESENVEASKKLQIL